MRVVTACLLALIVLSAILVLYHKDDEPQMLIDANWSQFDAGGDWCDVPISRRHPPRVKGTIEQVNPNEDDQRRIA